MLPDTITAFNLHFPLHHEFWVFVSSFSDAWHVSSAYLVSSSKMQHMCRPRSNEGLKLLCLWDPIDKSKALLSTYNYPPESVELVVSFLRVVLRKLSVHSLASL